ncbi:hypothetical protein BJV78DRAFT_1225581 [Lactifluus subvellereus]|nr:hypothetical protein BJV78DRAFT_1225581 [Lactifluus subvellereus]
MAGICLFSCLCPCLCFCRYPRSRIDHCRVRLVSTWPSPFPPALVCKAFSLIFRTRVCAMGARFNTTNLQSVTAEDRSCSLEFCCEAW